MYARRSCPVTRVNKASTPCCPPPRNYSVSTAVAPGQSIPESMRMLAQQCPTAVVTTQEGPSCATGPASKTVREVVRVDPAAPMPYVEVGTVPARITTQQNATAVIQAGYDQYNPATRFRQYFPPAPLPYVCPERIPNNLPIPTSVCVPVTRYEGSLAEAKRDGVI